MLGDIFFLSFYSCLYGWCAISCTMYQDNWEELLVTDTQEIIEVGHVDMLYCKKRFCEISQRAQVLQAYIEVS